MRLSDIMSHAGLSGYAVAALILFIVAFVAILFWIFAPGRKRELDRQSRLPLDHDDSPPDTRGGV
ncbi:MAG: cbb3-type cytochrome c oxidase subunit 3 [Gemmatimonadota bacterium]